MAMHRIKCLSCTWSTRPHYSIIDCIKEKELAHHFGYKTNNSDAHDSTFDSICPKCGSKTIDEYRYFPEKEIVEIERRIEREG